MRFSNRKKRTPKLNAAATSDISFMLLIFFLVTTSMNNEQGIGRLLPRLDNKEAVNASDINRKNILSLELTADNKLLADGEPLELNDVRSRVVSFVGKTSEREKHVISVKSSRDASYDTYFKLQNEIVIAYNMLRDYRARQIYKKPMAECSKEQVKALQEYYPQRIAEDYHTDEKGGTE